MKNLNIDYLCKAINGRIISGNGAAIFNGVSTDSRQIKPGQIYFALHGEKHDGHQFIGQAMANGGVAAVVSKEPQEYFSQPLILVNDTLQALQQLAQYYRGKFSIPLIAVTGSVGKTTTKEILAQCLSSRFNTLKTKGNFNNDIGLPLTLLSLEEYHQIAVVELGMRATGEIKRLTELAQPTAALITNVEPVHLETMHSLENIAQAKCEVLSGLSKEQFAVINGDNAVLMREAQRYECRKYTFGYKDTCDIQIKDIVVDQASMEIKAYFFQQEEIIVFPLPAAQLAANVVAAAAVGLLSGLDMTSMKEILKVYEPSGNRLNIVHINSGGILINDTYNANPASMYAALEVGSKLHQKGKFIAVLGDMFELGDYEKEGHVSVGRKTVEAGIDLLITIGSRSLMIAEGAKSAGMAAENIFSFSSKKAATDFIQQALKNGDTILFKASRGMELETIIQNLEL